MRAHQGPVLQQRWDEHVKGRTLAVRHPHGLRQTLQVTVQHHRRFLSQNDCLRTPAPWRLRETCAGEPDVVAAPWSVSAEGLEVTHAHPTLQNTYEPKSLL